MDNSLVFRVFQCNLLGDSELGFATVELSALMINAEVGEVSDHFSLFYNNSRVGHLLIKSQFEVPPIFRQETMLKERPPADFRYAKLKDKEKKTAAELEATKKAIETTTDR